MEQINVQVNAAGQTSEFYDLVTVKQKLDHIESIIDEGGSGHLIDEGSATDVEVEPGNTYMWTSTVPYLNVTLKFPIDEIESLDDIKNMRYRLMFGVDVDASNFVLTLIPTNSLVIWPKNDAAIVKGYNVVDISIGPGAFLVEINNHNFG